jgi:hypothetical protein
MAMITASDAMQLALREYADPGCRRCRGRGHRGDDLVGGLCRCVERRTPAAKTPPATGGEEPLPHPWGVITKRAQSIHAAALLQCVPDDWS